MASEVSAYPQLAKEILDMVQHDISDEGLSDMSEPAERPDYSDRKVVVADADYTLPVDEIEWDRQYKQHVMLLLALPGLYATPEAVRRALAPEDGVQKSILDIGTGTGTWAMAMANEFPHVEVVGIDLTPNMSLPTPPNCRFEFDDVNYGLPHYHGCFDVVHARSCTNGIKDYSAFIDEIALCLRPGGVILLAEGDFNLCGPDKVPLESASHGDEKGKSWFRRLLFEVYELMEARKSSLAGGAIVAHGLGDHPAFEQTGTKELHICIGPWETGSTPEETRHLNIIGTLMRQNSLEFARAWKPLLLSAEYSLDTVNDWIQRIDAELGSCSPPMYCRFQYCWGVKRPVPGTTTATPAAQPVAQINAASASTSAETVTSYDLPIWENWDVESRPGSIPDADDSRSSVFSGGPGSRWTLNSGDASSSWLPSYPTQPQASSSSSPRSRSSTPQAEGSGSGSRVPEVSGIVLPSYGEGVEASGSRAMTPACADVADPTPRPGTPRPITGKRSAAEFDEDDEVNQMLSAISPSPSICSSTRSTRSATRRKL